MFAEYLAKVFGALEKGIRGLLPLLVLLIYTLIGAYIFMHIEGPNEKFQLEESRRMYFTLLENTTHDLLRIRNMEFIPAKTYVEYHLLRYIGTLGVKAINVNHIKWDIWGSIYYTFCIYTTIGYGNIYPVTTTGRVITIIYAFIGIPLALLSLIALGRMLAKLSLALWTVLVRAPLGLVLKNFRKITKFDPDKILSEAEDSEQDLLRFPISFLILIALGWVLFSAYLLFQWESDWDFGTSLYFILISFTTIGFGDVITSSDRIFVVGFLLLVGLSLISTLLAIIQKQIEALAAGVKGNIDKEYLKALQEVDEDADRYYDEKNDVEKQQGIPVLVRAKSKSPGSLSLEAVVKRMPMRSRIIYKVMSEEKKKQLNEHAQSKMKLVNKACQAVVKTQNNSCQHIIETNEIFCQTYITSMEKACQTDPEIIKLKRTTSERSLCSMNAQININ